MTILAGSLVSNQIYQTDGSHGESTELGGPSEGLSPSASAGQSTSTGRHWVRSNSERSLTFLMYRIGAWSRDSVLLIWNISL